MSRITVPCDQCGAILTRKRSQIERSEYNFCDIKCRSAWRSENWRGDKNPSWKGGLIQLECEECGGNFRVKRHLAQQRFCSVACKGQWQSRHQVSKGNSNIAVNCAQCGIRLERTQWEVERRSRTGRFFCGIKCHAQWQSENWSGEHHPRWQDENWIEVQCAYCGEDVQKPARFAKNRERFFCDTICAHKWQSENCIGENSTNWRGGISLEPYSFEFNNVLKQQIRKRDRHVCQLCEASENGSTHHVHHIDYNKKNSKLTNLITLCRSCHGKTSGNRAFWQAYFSDTMTKKEKFREVTWKE